MANIKEENIVFLKITSWRGVSAGAQHWYGRLEPLEGEESFEVKYKIRKEEIQSYDDTLSEKLIECGAAYTIGEKTTRIPSREKVIASAKKQFKKFFPKATVLILGSRGTVEPQKVLVGPKEFKLKINKLAKRAEEINYWEEDEAEMQILCDKWQELWPIKYI